VKIKEKEWRQEKNKETKREIFKKRNKYNINEMIQEIRIMTDSNERKKKVKKRNKKIEWFGEEKDGESGLHNIYIWERKKWLSQLATFRGERSLARKTLFWNSLYYLWKEKRLCCYLKADFKQPLVWLGKVYLGKFGFVKVSNIKF
jgi:hypothetical protein